MVKILSKILKRRKRWLYQIVSSTENYFFNLHFTRSKLTNLGQKWANIVSINLEKQGQYFSVLNFKFYRKISQSRLYWIQFVQFGQKQPIMNLKRRRKDKLYIFGWNRSKMFFLIFKKCWSIKRNCQRWDETFAFLSK